MANDDLKIKYQHQTNRINAMCKAIGDSTHTQITTQVARNGTVRFEVIGHRVKVAVEQVLNEFCKVCCSNLVKLYSDVYYKPFSFTSLAIIF